MISCSKTKNNLCFAARYRGYYYDNETGYYYLQSRYYDPELGRFISAEDFSYINSNTPLNVNAYAYCANNPLIYSDPKGTAYISEVGQAVAEITIRYVYEPIKELLGYCVMGVLKYMRTAFNDGLTIFYSYIKFDFKLESSKLKIKETFSYLSMYILMEWELNLPSYDLTPVPDGIFTVEWLAIIKALVELALSMLAAGVEIFI